MKGSEFIKKVKVLGKRKGIVARVDENEVKAAI